MTPGPDAAPPAAPPGSHQPALTAADGVAGVVEGADGVLDAATASLASLALRVLQELQERGATLATAESLTGGLLSAELTAVPGASAVYRGGVVSYASDLKHRLLGVDEDLLARVGAVDGEVAAAMAAGAADLLGTDHALATTGVAGPDPQDGRPVGTVFVACTRPEGTSVRRLALAGDRAAIRAATVRAALALLLDELSVRTAGDGNTVR